MITGAAPSWVEPGERRSSGLRLCLHVGEVFSAFQSTERSGLHPSWVMECSNYANAAAPHWFGGRNPSPAKSVRPG